MIADGYHWRLFHSPAYAKRLRAGLLVGRVEEFTLVVNARHCDDPWIREMCRFELERRKELDK